MFFALRVSIRVKQHWRVTVSMNINSAVASEEDIAVYGSFTEVPAVCLVTAATSYVILRKSVRIKFIVILNRKSIGTVETKEKTRCRLAFLVIVFLPPRNRAHSGVL